MPHELEIVDGKASMFYAQKYGLPWHKLGTGADENEVDLTDTNTILKLAGIDWETSLKPLYVEAGVEVEKFVGNVRDRDSKVLGIVRKDGVYEIIQNREMVEFVQSLSQDFPIKFSSAGSLFGGEVTWAAAEMESDMRINDDDYRKFILASTSHNGTRALAIHPTNVNVVCNNTLTLATSARALIKIRHSRTKDDQMAEARRAFAITTETQRRMQEWLEQAASTPIEGRHVQLFRDDMFGPYDDATPAVRVNAIEAWTGIFSEEARRNGRTAYALANSVTGYADHATRFHEGEDARFTSIFKGSAFAFKKKGMLEVAKITNLPLPVAI